MADGPLISKWRKPGYEILCSLASINKSNTNFGTTSICRVPLGRRAPNQRVTPNNTTGCISCCSGDGMFFTPFPFLRLKIFQIYKFFTNFPDEMFFPLRFFCVGKFGGPLWWNTPLTDDAEEEAPEANRQVWGQRGAGEAEGGPARGDAGEEGGVAGRKRGRDEDEGEEEDEEEEEEIPEEVKRRIAEMRAKMNAQDQDPAAGAPGADPESDS